MTYYSKKRGVKKSFKNGKVKSRLSFKNKNKKNKKNKKPRTRRRNRRLNGGAGNLGDELKTVYTEDKLKQDIEKAFVIIFILLILHYKNKDTITSDTLKTLNPQDGGTRPSISSPITVQLNGGTITVHAEVVNKLRENLTNEASVAELNKIVRRYHTLF